MGKKELSGRLNWERLAGAKAVNAEQNLYKVFEAAFEGTKYKLHKKPKHLKNLYASVELNENVLSEIFNPDIDFKKNQMGSFYRFCNRKYRNRKDFIWGNKKARRLG